MIYIINRFILVLIAVLTGGLIIGCSTSAATRGATVSALYAESITEAFKRSGPGPRLYVVDDPLLADIKAQAPAIAQYIKGRKETASVSPRPEDLVYKVTITDIEETDEGFQALATFYATAESATVYLIRIKRTNRGWRLLSFDVKGIA
jgi:hypothetical protein